MRAASILPYLLVLALFLAGCAGETSDTPPPAAPVQSTSKAPTASPGDTDLTRKWGPDTMPDKDTEPLEFLYWRVDTLFEDKDLDRDGRLTLVEFGGVTMNFERIDADVDGFVIKKEVIDDMTRVMREQGTIP